jgi:hypothetical protein
VTDAASKLPIRCARLLLNADNSVFRSAVLTTELTRKLSHDGHNPYYSGGGGEDRDETPSCFEGTVVASLG